MLESEVSLAGRGLSYATATIEFHIEIGHDNLAAFLREGAAYSGPRFLDHSASYT